MVARGGFLVSMILCGFAGAAFAMNGVSEQALFVPGEGGYSAYRIPALITTVRGTVLAFCEGRKHGRGDSGDIDLLVKRSEDSGNSWSGCAVVWDDGVNTCGNPCPVVDERTGHIHLLMTWNRGSDHGRELHAGSAAGTRRVFYSRSEDDGRTWLPPIDITDQAKDPGWWWYATGPGVGIQLKRGPHRGRLVVPCDHTAEGYFYGSHVIFSDDAGVTWERSEAIKPTCNESQVVELKDGRLMMNMRSQERKGTGRPRNGFRSISFSSDGGATWSDPEFDTNLGDPVCQASIIRYDRERLLFSNPSPPARPARGKRIRMTVRVSRDEGGTWPVAELIHEGPSAYSCLTRLPDDNVGLLYEKDKSISMAIISRPVLFGETEAGVPSRPNVLFLAVDDMKDWVNCLGGYEGTVRTPSIDRLARQGMLFSRAYCASPKCAPSRAAIMTGMMPSKTGLYGNGHWWLPNLPDAVTIPAHFRAHGYRAVGAGKIFHHTAGNNPPNQWDDFFRLTFRNDPWFRGVKRNYPWSEHGPYPEGFPFSEVKGLGHENDWGSLGIPEAEYDDSLSADYAIDFLEKKHDRPFFLACGLFRPHLPWYVPQKYFDLYPVRDTVLPEVMDDDLDDLPEGGRKMARRRREDLETILGADRWKHAVRAYLASISYSDAQLGRVLDALDASPYRGNTVIVLWSDHGWHLGEKNHWHKSTLWEEATRVPLIIDVPGLDAGECGRPVSLVDLFPTLNALCGLPDIGGHDGRSLVPLLRDPDMTWKHPAVIEFGSGNAAVRSERYRYIRYREGGEELYDHRSDPREWYNRIEDPAYSEIRKRLSEALPGKWAEPALTKGAFDFDPESFTWKHTETGVITEGK